MEYFKNIAPRRAAFIALVVFSFFVALIAMFLEPSLLSVVPQLFNTTSNSTGPLVTNHRTGVSYAGRNVDGIEQFHSIYYAKDTSGANRFAPPVPYMPKPGTIIDATTPGAWCPQGTGGPPFPFTSPITNISENCLSLSIARSSKPGTSKELPVLVWIHGGGNALGSGSDILYTPTGIVEQARSNGQPVIWVAINYRLGVFGYATSKALISAKQTNAGLRDQRAALQWVRDNIEAFGGDPNNVVAVGQSVGAMSIGLHLVSFEGSKGVPFQRAIMMSGASGTNFNIRSSMSADHTARAAAAVGCTGDPDSQATLDCLRSVPFEQLTNISVGIARKARPPFGELFFSPSYDGDLITDRPSVLLRRKAFVKGIPLIAAWTTNDGAWYAQPGITQDTEVTASFENFVLGLSESSLKTLLSLYPLSDFEVMVQPTVRATAQYFRAAQMNRDIWFTCPVLDYTYKYFQGAGTKSVHLYEFNQTKFAPIFQYMGIPQWRVSHLSDIPYMLNEDVAAGGDNSEPQKELSRLLSGSAAAFAWTGDPSNTPPGAAKVLSNWPRAYQPAASETTWKIQSIPGPAEANILITGGEWGNGPVKITDSNKSASTDREKAIAWEKIIQRCRFINSITNEIDV